MKKLIFALLMAVMTVTFAQSVPIMQQGLGYQDPTEYTDGSALPLDEIQVRTLDCGLSPGNYTLSMVAPAGGLVARDEIVAQLGLDYGVTYYCAMTVTATNDLTSAYSAEVNFTVEDQRVPRPPVLQIL